MLERSKLYANLKAPDLDEAVEFYAGKLGLAVLWDGDIIPGHREALFSAGGGVVCVEAGQPTESQTTPASFAVADVEAASRHSESEASSSRSTTFRVSRPSTASQQSGS